MGNQDVEGRVELVRLTTSRTLQEAAVVLRSRLRSVLVVLLAASVLNLVREIGFHWFGDASRLYIVSPVLFAAHLVFSALLGAGVWLLSSRISLSTRRLKWIEGLAFLIAASLVASYHYWVVKQQVGVGDPGMVLATIRSFMFLYFLLMVVYGLFVPNSGKSAARIVVPLALLSPAMSVFMALVDDEFRRLCGVVISFEQISFASTLLLMGAGTVIYGAHVMNNLRREASEARRMGQYRLVERIGSGGMGEVWRAEHRMLVRPAAIKLIRPEMLGGVAEAAQSVVSRFEREAQATARLQSPHTIQVHDFGIAEDGTFFYVMELLEGLDLESMVTRFGPLPAERAAGLLTQICDSLAEAHHTGLVHRDIKPANVFACRCALQVDFIKVLDFGLVKHWGGHEGTRLTLAGTVTGTPAYLAPEVARDASKATCYSDIYSLGCVAYWLVTGHQVFEGATPMDVILQHVQASPVPPSHRTELQVPEEFERVILACLEKDPDKRPRSMLEVKRALEACRFPQSWNQERACDWWSLHLPSGRPVCELSFEPERNGPAVG